MLSDEKTVALKRVLSRGVSQEEQLPRIPPNSEKLFENIPWLNIMADIAITAAVAEIQVLKQTRSIMCLRVRKLSNLEYFSLHNYQQYIIPPGHFM